MDEVSGGQEPPPAPGEGPRSVDLDRQLAVARQLRVLLDVAARLGAARDSATLARITVEAMVECFGAELAELWVPDGPDRVALAAGAGAEVARPEPLTLDVAAEASLVAEVARTRLPVVTSQLVSPFAPVLVEGEPLVGAAVLPLLSGDPLVSGDGQLVGVVAAWFTGPVPVEVADVLAAFGAVVTSSLNRARELVEPHPGRPYATAGTEPPSVLLEAGEALLASLDPTTTIAVTGRLAVRLADWATVSVLDDDGIIRRVGTATADPARADTLEALAARFPAGAGVERLVPEVIATGRSELIAEVTDADLGPLAADDEYAGLAHRLGLGSAMVVPLTVDGTGTGGTLGALTLVEGEHRTRYGTDDLALAEELARRGAAALGNARAHRRLQEAEQRLRSFVDGLGAILWEADASTFDFSFVSHRAEDVLGYPVQRWIDEPGFWASRIHPADREYTVSYRRVATAEGRDHELEYRMLGADGREVWLQDLVYLEVDGDGRPRRLMGIMVDITQRKRVEHVLLESRERFASLARTLQASLLPPHLPEIFGLEVAARYRPAEDGVEVVGDFYDLFDVGDDGWGVVIGDVCGKGPEAAALTAVARYTVRAAAMRERHPSRVLRLLNEAVLHHDAGERFCTAAYARVVPAGERVSLSLACGGHPLPLLLRADGSVEAAGRPGTLLGLLEEPDLVDVKVVLEPGDALVFFTDGAIEAKRRGVVLGEERLQAVVQSCAGLRAEEIAGRVEDAILAFQDGTPQDDLALVVLRVPG